MNDNKIKISWFKTLQFRTNVFIVFLISHFLIAVAFFSYFKYNEFFQENFEKESSLFSENILNELENELEKVNNFTKTLGRTAENLQKDEAVFINKLPKIVDFSKNENIVGVGIFPEAFAFSEEKEKMSFFWEKNINGKFEFSENYNSPEFDYFKEEWYSITKFFPKNRCIWGKIFVEPTSFQAMVTLSMPIFEDEKYKGAVTVDYNLKKIQELTEKLKEKTGGYIFITDQYNKFVSFPKLNLIKEKNSENFISAIDFSKKENSFSKISDELEKLNYEILRHAKKMPDFKVSLYKEIENSSSKISKKESEFFSAIISNPIEKNNLNKSFDIENDFFYKEKSKVHILNLKNYWKLGIVIPESKSSEKAFIDIINVLIFASLIGMIILLIFLFLFIRFNIFNPLKKTKEQSEKMQDYLRNNNIKDLIYTNFLHLKNDEIGRINIYFSRMLKGVQNFYLYEFEELKEENDEQKTKIESVSDNRDELLKELKVFEDEKLNLLTKNEVVEEKLTEVIKIKHSKFDENEISIKNIEIENLKNQLYQEKTSMEKLEMELSEKKKEIENFEIEISDKGKEIKYWKDEIESKSEEIENLKSVYSEKDNEIENLVIDFSKKEEEIENLRGDFFEKDEEIENLRNEIENKNEEIENLKSFDSKKDNEIENLEIKFSGKEEEIENLRNELANKLDETENSNEKFVEEIENFKKENEELEINFSKKEEENENLRGDFFEKDEEIENLRNEIENKNEEIENLKSFDSEKENEIENLEIDFSKKEEEIENLRNELADKIDEIENLNEKFKKEIENFKKESETSIEVPLKVEAKLSYDKNEISRDIEFISFEIWENVLFIPQISEIDENWKKNGLNFILESLRKNKSEYLIFDISKMKIKNEELVSKELLKISQVSNLMGVECIFIGFEKEICKLFLEMNIDLTRIKTQIGLQQSLRYIFSKKNLK
ncbi:MAG: hypothetical protein B6I24_03950 [Bacteroidetes bacterium 4572_128]|nr:MAG: hypothetical protein B6I24_03950 [Bacteroidetes bacterium 4572_128]